MKLAKKTLCVILAVVMTLFLLVSTSCTSQGHVNTREEASWLMENGRAVQVYVVTLSNGTKAYEWISGDYTNAERATIKKYIEREYQATEIRSATTKYNCHSYAWYSTSSANKYWINDPSRYIRSATFLKKQTSGFNSLPSGISVNDRAVYKSGNTIIHSAIVNSTSSANSRLISKWGSYGLYTHSLTKCPYYQGNSNVSISYYRK